MSAKSRARRAYARSQSQNAAIMGGHLEEGIALESGVSKQTFAELKNHKSEAATVNKTSKKGLVDGPIEVTGRPAYFLARDLQLDRASLHFLLKSQVSEILDAIWDKAASPADKKERKALAKSYLLAHGAVLYNSTAAPVRQTPTTVTTQRTVLTEMAPVTEQLKANLDDNYRSPVEEVAAITEKHNLPLDSTTKRTTKNQLLSQAMSLLAEGKIDSQQFDFMVSKIS